MIKKEICIFLIVGIITVIIDFLIYYILLEFVIKSIDISKPSVLYLAQFFLILQTGFGHLDILVIKSILYGSLYLYTLLH